jgi:hypothetical protein
MTTIIRFEAADGVPVLVEADDESVGAELVRRGADGAIPASERLEKAFASVRAAIKSALHALGDLGSDELVLELGVKLSAESGAIIAKTAAEGHLTVTATWSRRSTPPIDGES